MAAGILGVLLPIIPGTPFILMGMVLLVKESRRINLWIHRHRYWGPRIRAYRKNPGITLKEKLIMISLMWTSVAGSFIFSSVNGVSITFLVVGIIGTVFMGFIVRTARVTA